MSDEYRNQFISCLVLGNNFDVEEYDSFKARVTSFKSEGPLTLMFEIEDDRLAWKAVEYEDEDFGETIMEGLVSVTLKDTPSDTHEFDLFDGDAHEFISELFPKGAEIVQLYADENMFLVDDVMYDFGSMRSGEKFIHFEFNKK
jgi:hypothetical protein